MPNEASIDMIVRARRCTDLPVLFFFFLRTRPPPRSTLFPSPPFFRSDARRNPGAEQEIGARYVESLDDLLARSDFVSLHVPLLAETRHLMDADRLRKMKRTAILINRSEEHTSELQSPCNLVCRLLLEK